VRAKLPRGLGVWPAIWMLGTSIDKVGWPKMRRDRHHGGGRPRTGQGLWNRPLVRYGKSKHASLGGKLTGQSPADDFHVYAVEWFADRMDFFYDDVRYFTYPLDKAGAGEGNPFNKPHYLLLNFAIGGSWAVRKG
jgi:beta-glucanase (GH16 family)